MRIAEVDRDVRRQGEPGVICQLGSTVPGQGSHQALWQPADLTHEGSDDAFADLASDPHELDEPGPALDERGDVAVAGAAQKIALSVAGHGAILDLGRALPDRAGADDLAPRLASGGGHLGAGTRGVRNRTLRSNGP